MKTKNYLVIGPRGIVKATKTRPGLEWNQLLCQIELNIPDELFKRPQIMATLTIKDIPNGPYDMQVVLNTKELIEQQTGAKIDFKIVKEHEEMR